MFLYVKVMVVQILELELDPTDTYPSKRKKVTSPKIPTPKRIGETYPQA